jgi:hypothetical protein
MRYMLYWLNASQPDPDDGPGGGGQACWNECQGKVL